MAIRQVYETAFDSAVSPRDADEDDETSVLETSRRLCSPDPSQVRIQKPSPASSRSSTDSERTPTVKRGRMALKSPKLPLKKLFSPSWLCGADPKLPNGSETPAECSSSSFKPGRNDPQTFSPSVEFKKLDVADEFNRNTEPHVGQSNNTPWASTRCCHENGPEPPSPRLPIRSEPDKDSVHVIRPINDDIVENQSNFSFARPNRDEVKRSNTDSIESGARKKLWLDFSRAPKRPRRHLFLDANSDPQDPGESLEPKTYLMKQGWYHGSISRTDAENLLRLMKKGSFLVRCSQKVKCQYLLSLKSSRGVVHVKIIQLPNGKYVIKQQTQSFDSIPQMIEYFSTHILNIHEMNVYLSHPVIEKLL